MLMTLHWIWLDSLTWGDRIQVNSKEKIDNYHQKGFEIIKKKKNPVHFYSPLKLSVISENASAENAEVQKAVRVGE